MPVGKHLELYNGRVFITKDNVLYFSEPLAYQAFDGARNWVPFDSTITMNMAVVDGLYIGTPKGVFFLLGKDIQSMNLITVTTSPPIEYTAVKIDGRNVLDGDKTTQAVMWTSKDGIYVGYPGGYTSSPGGQAQNLTKDKLRYPSGNSGSAVVYHDVYLSLIDP